MKKSPKIDVFAHIMPPKYKDALLAAAPANFPHKKGIIESVPMIHDLKLRFQEMDKHEGLRQVLTMAQPPLEAIFSDTKTALELARIANDGMAELVNQYPDRFAGAVACLPMGDPDVAVKELDRAIGQLKLNGIQIHTPCRDKPLDLPEYATLFERMAHYDLPIWIHPKRTLDYPDYKGETGSKYVIAHVFGWPYESTTFMTRLVFGGMFDRLPRLKIIIHHAGAMIPFFERRIKDFYERYRLVFKEDWATRLEKPAIDYFKMFYNDTAVNGSAAALMCAYSFFGADKLLFGTDMPLGDVDNGFRNTKDIIASVEQMTISDSEKKLIFEGNTRRLLRLEK